MLFVSGEPEFPTPVFFPEGSLPFLGKAFCRTWKVRLPENSDSRKLGSRAIASRDLLPNNNIIQQPFFPLVG